MQVISTPDQSDAMLLVSILEVLKMKAKANKDLAQSIQKTIIHLKNPLKIKLKQQTLESGLETIELYHLTCMIIARFYSGELKGKNNYDWKELISRISTNCDKNMQMGLEVLNMLLPNYQGFSKDVSKSGLVKYICLVYLLQVLNEKNHLYRALKVLKLVASNDRTVLIGRQKNISTVIYTHSRYLIVAKEISQACYDHDYCQKLWNQPIDVDSVYVWSYNQNFSSSATQREIKVVEKMLDNKAITAEQEWKLYAILNNISKSCPNLVIDRSSRIPKHA